MNAPDDDGLRKLLHEWREVPEEDPGLAFRVQRVIERRPQRTLLQAFQALTRPRLALVSIAAGMIIGVAYGEWRVGQGRVAAESEMPARYRQWIDPALGPGINRVAR